MFLLKVSCKKLSRKSVKLFQCSFISINNIITKANQDSVTVTMALSDSTIPVEKNDLLKCFLWKGNHVGNFSLCHLLAAPV